MGQRKETSFGGSRDCEVRIEIESHIIVDAIMAIAGSPCEGILNFHVES